MKARSSSKRWCAQKASSLFSFSLWSRDGVHTCIRWLGAKTWQTVGRITWHGSRATLSKEKLASGGNNINGFWWNGWWKRWIKRIVDTENRGYECRAYLCPLPLVIERFARYYAPWSWCIVLCQLWPFKQYWKGCFFFFFFFYDDPDSGLDKVWFIEGWFFLHFFV